MIRRPPGIFIITDGFKCSSDSNYSWNSVLKYTPIMKIKVVFNRPNHLIKNKITNMREADLVK